jgi:hypothetical protein
MSVGRSEHRDILDHPWGRTVVIPVFTMISLATEFALRTCRPHDGSCALSWGSLAPGSPQLLAVNLYSLQRLHPVPKLGSTLRKAARPLAEMARLIDRNVNGDTSSALGSIVLHQ